MMLNKHLNLDRRIVIQNLIEAGKSQTEIASLIKCHKSTISKELSRNTKNNQDYCAYKAQYNYQQNRKKHEDRKLEKNPSLLAYTIYAITSLWSPEQISGRLKIDFPKNEKMRISHETIYKFIFQEKQKEKSSFSKLYQYLRHKNKKNYKRGRPKKRNLFLNKKSIHDRPKIVENRKRKGDWEGDLIEGANKSGYIATYVDRKNKNLIAAKMNDKSAESLNQATIEAFKNQGIKNEEIKTITFDNGTEFARFYDLEDHFKCDIYFADPSSPWQRGTNENTNKLLRQFFPKKTNFSKIDQNMLDQAVYSINNRPRKQLNYLTPYEYFHKSKVAFQT